MRYFICWRDRRGRRILRGMQSADVRQCVQCSKTLPTSEFYASGLNDGKLRGQCKVCCRARTKAAPRTQTLEHRADYARRSGRVKADAPYRDIAARKASAAQRREEVEGRRIACEAWAEWLTVRAPSEWVERYQAARDALKQPPVPAKGSKEWLAIQTSAEAKAYRAERNAAWRKKYRETIEYQRARVIRYQHANPERVAKWKGRRGAWAAERNDGTLTSDVIRGLFGAAKICPYDGMPLKGRKAALDHMIPLSRGGVHSLVNVVVCCDRCNHSKLGRSYEAWVAMLAPKDAARALKLYRGRYGIDPAQATLALAF